ncbi:hypothetical protein ANCCAN_06682 [Ancylostoma caninum]|uniref:Uncharacterized protein n=1 Tax=Ancylostoma caninum TaxID=29170 RepID=A0A368GW45_ANCCA|nr:hypothetical protein ANCCAN_06682 [Ancylostoma caninum]
MCYTFRFWQGWEYENLFNREVIRYKLADDVHDFEFSLSDNASPEERQQVHAAINRNWEDSQATNIETELNTQRRLLAQRIKDPNSAQQFDEDNCRQTIEDLTIVRLFNDAAFTNMDVEVRREYAARIETALRGRFQYPHDSILFAMSAWSPVSISNYDASQSSDRGRVAEFFGFDKQRLENDVKEVNNDLSKPLPANVRELLSLADQSLTYYVPTLNKIMTAKPSHVTRRKALLELFARIISIRTNTADVERGFSLYKSLREAVHQLLSSTWTHISESQSVAPKTPPRIISTSS